MSARSREHISRVRAEAGRKGGKARWAAAKREPTRMVRIYTSDAARLAAEDGTMAEAVRRLLVKGR